MPKIYSDAFRNDLIRTLNSPHAPSVLELSAKTGVHQTTLSRWRRDGATVRKAMTQGQDDTDQRTRPPPRPQDFSAEEKLRIVQQASTLQEVELGAFLRREGLHEPDLSEWREQVNDAALAALGGKRQRTSEQKRVRKLESELLRKDKALAEAAALLVLARKTRALWQDEDDDTTGSDEE